MLADGHAVEGELARAFGDGDQGEVGSAAADIHHQDEIAHLDALAPVGVAFDPGIEGGLGLFEQGEVAVAGLLSGFERELARHRIEGSRHRHQYLLIGEGGLRHAEIPSLAEVFEVAAAGFHGRDLVDAFGSAKRHQRGGAVHGRMGEPALGRGDQPAGIFRAALLRQLPHHEIAVGVPGQRQGSRGKVGAAGQVEKRGQQVLVADLAGVGELRDRHHLHVGGGEGVGVRQDGGEGQRRVGGAEIDSNDVSGFHGIRLQHPG